MLNIFGIGLVLALNDIKQAYRRSALGSFWLTIGMAVQILMMGLVFGLIFRADIFNYLPFLATSIIFWNLISTSLNEGCTTFTNSSEIIKQLNIPKLQFVFRVVWRNLISAGHNFAILPLLFLVLWKSPGLSLVAIIPGLSLIIFNITWVVLMLGIVSARYRDMTPITSSVMTMAFYITPVMWYPELLGNNEVSHLLLGLNPFYHWLQIVRLPILGEWPTWENWAVSTLSSIIGWGVSLLVYRRHKSMIAFWV